MSIAISPVQCISFPQASRKAPRLTRTASSSPLGSTLKVMDLNAPRATKTDLQYPPGLGWTENTPLVAERSSPRPKRSLPPVPQGPAHSAPPPPSPQGATKGDFTARSPPKLRTVVSKRKMAEKPPVVVELVAPEPIQEPKAVPLVRPRPIHALSVTETLRLDSAKEIRARLIASLLLNRSTNGPPRKSSRRSKLKRAIILRGMGIHIAPMYIPSGLSHVLYSDDSDSD